MQICDILIHSNNNVFDCVGICYEHINIFVIGKFVISILYWNREKVKLFCRLI